MQNTKLPINTKVLLSLNHTKNPSHKTINKPRFIIHISYFNLILKFKKFTIVYILLLITRIYYHIFHCK
jgi:hypothetical protein